MSRIGNQPVPISDNVELSIEADNLITVKGAKGTDSLRLHPAIRVEKSNGELLVTRASDSKEHRSLHGLYRSLINNMVTGVTEGFTVQLEVIGVGFRAALSGEVLELHLGFSHPIFFCASGRDLSGGGYQNPEESHHPCKWNQQGSGRAGGCQNPLPAEAGALQRERDSLPG